MKTKELSLSFLFSLLTLAFVLTSCQTEVKNKVIDDEVMIKVPQSNLYARVRGDASKPLLINLHGGPGGYSGIDIHLMGPYLESDFLVAYLDQRGCGKSDKCTDTTMLTVEQYINDLDIVIDSLKAIYGKEQVGLMGTSWGGMYGFLYLLQQQEKVFAYACIDGKANSHYQNHSLIDYELSLATELLETAESEDRKVELETIISELKRIKASNFEHFHTDVNWMKHKVPAKLGFNAYFADTSKIISFKKVVEDIALMELMKYDEEEYMEVAEKAEIVNTAFRNTPSYNNINIEPDLKDVTTPTMVVQGAEDYVVGTQHAQLIYDALISLDSTKKELHIIDNVGHCPAIESPDTLGALLVKFFSGNTPK